MIIYKFKEKYFLTMEELREELDKSFFDYFPFEEEILSGKNKNSNTIKHYIFLKENCRWNEKRKHEDEYSYYDERIDLISERDKVLWTNGQVTTCQTFYEGYDDLYFPKLRRKRYIRTWYKINIEEGENETGYR